MHTEFTVHVLDGEGLGKSQRIAKVFDNALSELEQVCPPSREFSIVKTKLEEACFFAKKAMANEPSNQRRAVEGTAGIYAQSALNALSGMRN